MRMRSDPPVSVAGGEEQGDVRLSLLMNAVALQSLSTLASLTSTLQAMPSAGRTGVDNNSAELVRVPFAMLATMLEEVPEQSLVSPAT